jgi:hypothetical protein
MKAKLDLKSITPRLKQIKKLLTQHAIFGAAILVLLTYLFMVFQINKLASVEPSADAESAATAKTKIPKVDSKAIQQIQALEKSNTRVHSLFEHARNNPFQE